MDGEPRTAVEQADELVAELMRHLAETFADERSRLESAWSAGEDVDTQVLPLSLTRLTARSSTACCRPDGDLVAPRGFPRGVTPAGAGRAS